MWWEAVFVNSSLIFTNLFWLKIEGKKKREKNRNIYQRNKVIFFGVKLSGCDYVYSYKFLKFHVSFTTFKWRSWKKREILSSKFIVVLFILLRIILSSTLHIEHCSWIAIIYYLVCIYICSIIYTYNWVKKNSKKRLEVSCYSCVIGYSNYSTWF